MSDELTPEQAQTAELALTVVTLLLREFAYVEAMKKAGLHDELAAIWGSTEPSRADE